MAEKSIKLNPQFWEIASKLWAQKCEYTVSKAIEIKVIDHDDNTEKDFDPFDLDDI